jgi:tripartite-type tricarboxylate transporter receptor subunit TctC
MMKAINRRHGLTALTMGMLGWPGLGLTQSDSPVRLIVTFPPGGSTDITARILQPILSQRLGRPVLVDNKPGAASQVGTQFVAKSAPDGNTLLVCFDSHAINPIAKPNLPYDTFKDFAGVTLAVRFPLVIAASAGVKTSDLRGFLDEARQNPGKFSYASTGLGSMNHLVMEDIKRRAKVEVLHVPYSGGGPAVQAVLGDTSQITLLSYAALRAQIQAGKVKALAVTGAKRLAELPQVPTVAESGFAGFEAYSWIGIFAPSATPAPTLQRLTEDFRWALNQPDVHTKLTAGGFEVMATDGAAVDRYAREQYERWSAFVRDTHIRLEQ